MHTRHACCVCRKISGLKFVVVGEHCAYVMCAVFLGCQPQKHGQHIAITALILGIRSHKQLILTGQRISDGKTN